MYDGRKVVYAFEYGIGDSIMKLSSHWLGNDCSRVYGTEKNSERSIVEGLILFVDLFPTNTLNGLLRRADLLPMPPGIPSH